MMQNTTNTKSALWLVVSLSAGSVWSQATSGPVALEQGGGPAVISKVPVADCRVVRGCFGSPIEGSVHSWDYRGTVRECLKTASDGVGYAYNNNDGVRLTLADGDGFDAVVLRGGAKTGLSTTVGQTTLHSPGVAPRHRPPTGQRSECTSGIRPVCLCLPAVFGHVRGMGTLNGNSTCACSCWTPARRTTAASGARSTRPASGGVKSSPG